MAIIAPNFKKKEKQQIVNEEKTKDKYQFDKNKLYLVINGTPKEISMKSKYLLDMLIIEEGN